MLGSLDKRTHLHIICNNGGIQIQKHSTIKTPSSKVIHHRKSISKKSGISSSQISKSCCFFCSLPIGCLSQGLPVVHVDTLPHPVLTALERKQGGDAMDAKFGDINAGDTVDRSEIR